MFSVFLLVDVSANERGISLSGDLLSGRRDRKLPTEIGERKL